MRTYTTKEVAPILKMSQQNVIHLCASGYIDATKMGNMWIITQKSLDEYKPRHRGRHASEPYNKYTKWYAENKQAVSQRRKAGGNMKFIAPAQ